MRESPRLPCLVWNYTEPFFFIPFLTGHSGWIFNEPSTIPSGEHRLSGAAAPTQDSPTPNTPQMIAALQFVADLVQTHRVLPRAADYETAQALFRAGKAAMIIDGDWSWQGYLADPSLDPEVAVLPIVSSTGLPMAPMVAPKGYSLTASAARASTA